jgi:hypothetical protein
VIIVCSRDEISTPAPHWLSGHASLRKTRGRAVNPVVTNSRYSVIVPSRVASFSIHTALTLTNSLRP